MARTLNELVAFQLAHRFKLELYKLLRNHPDTRKDLRFCSQLREAARGCESNVAEGWRRFGLREMAQFLRIALGSNEEAQVRLRDGIDCEYFTEIECETAFEFGRRSGAAIMALLKSIESLPPRPPARPRRRRE